MGARWDWVDIASRSGNLTAASHLPTVGWDVDSEQGPVHGLATANDDPDAPGVIWRAFDVAGRAVLLGVAGDGRRSRGISRGSTEAVRC